MNDAEERQFRTTVVVTSSYKNVDEMRLRLRVLEEERLLQAKERMDFEVKRSIKVDYVRLLKYPLMMTVDDCEVVPVVKHWLGRIDQIKKEIYELRTALDGLE